MSSIVLALALSAIPVSTSKLGVFVGTDISSTTNAIIATCPALAVFPFDVTDQNFASTIGPSVRSYVSTCPQGRVVLRMNPSGIDAQQMVQSQLAASLLANIQTVGLRAGFDAVEIPFTIDTPIEVATYWAQLAQQLSSLYLPLIGAGTITNPSAFCPIASAIRAGGFNGFGIGFQAITPMAKNPNDSAFVFDQVSLACAANGVPLAGVPMFLTQLRPTGVWDQNAMTWLAWFDQQAALMGLQGAALFQLGGVPDISAIAPSLVKYFPNPTLPGGGTPDDGGGGGSSGVVVSPHDSAGGELSPPKGGCSTAEPTFMALLIIPALIVLRKRVTSRSS